MLRSILVCVSLCVLVGCGGGSDGGGGDGGGASVGRGSAACRDWQDALCDFVSQQCGGLSRALCDEQYQGVSCLSDATATACSNAFNSSSCASPPASCDIADIADPAPAQQACREFIDHLCASGIRCGQYATDAECQADTTSGGLDCETIAVFKLSYETCLEEIDALSCTAVALPASCNDVFLRVQP